MSPVTLNRAQRTWLLPNKTGKFMQCGDGQEAWVRAEKLAVSLRSARKAELISKSRSKIRNPHENVRGHPLNKLPTLLRQERRRHSLIPCESPTLQSRLPRGQ